MRGVLVCSDMGEGTQGRKGTFRRDEGVSLQALKPSMCTHALK